MNIYNISLENLELDYAEKKELIDSMPGDDKWDIASALFDDQPETFFLWIAEDEGRSREDLERQFGKDNVYNFYKYLKRLYEV